MKKLVVLSIALFIGGFLMAQEPVHLDTASFKEKVHNYEKSQEWNYLGDKPAIIDFYADWCAPCRQIAPIMKDIAQDYEGDLVVYKIDTEKQKELAAAFGIRALPSILFIPKNGQPQLAKGAMPRQKFDQVINNVFNIPTQPQ